MTTPRRAPGPRYQALIQLLRTAETLWNASRVFFARWQLSPSQFNLLNLVVDAPEGLTQTELGRQLLMHRSNVTGLVDRLEARGLVRRQDQAGDRRAYRVVLTSEGHRLVGSILPHYYAVAEEVWGQLPPPQARRMAGEFQHLCENAERAAARLTGGSGSEPEPANGA